MPETFPNVSISDLIHEAQGKVDSLHETMKECEAAIDVEVERVRQAFGVTVSQPASVAPPEAESAPVPTDAGTEPEPTAPADPPAETPPAEPVPTEPATSADAPPLADSPASDVPAA